MPAALVATTRWCSTTAPARPHRRFGYRRVHDLLRLKFPAVNHKRVYRLYSEANLAVRKRKKVRRPRPSARR